MSADARPPATGATLKIFRSPFRLDDVRWTTLPAGLTVGEIVRDHLPAEVPFACVLRRGDGSAEPVSPERYGAIVPAAGETLVCVPVPGDDKASILGLVVAVAAIAVSYGALAPYVGAAYTAAFAPGAIGSMLTATAITVVGGLAVSALAKAEMQTADTTGWDSSQAYSWAPHTTQQEGTAVPRLYGTHPCYGNIVAASTSGTLDDKQYLNVLISLGMGPVSRLYDFKINDQPVENFRGVEIHTRAGLLDQDPIPGFEDVKTEYAVSVLVSSDTPYVYTTVGSAFDAVEVDLSFPGGLWHADSDGGLGTCKVKVRVEIRQQGAETWENLSVEALEWSEDAGGYWTAGNWTSAMPPYVEKANVWCEVARGGAGPTDHYDGEPYAANSMFFWRFVPPAGTTTATETADYVTIAGRKTAAVRRTFSRQNLEAGHHYEIRVTKITEDRSSSSYGDELYLSAVREVVYDAFEYPRTVLVGIKALATDQLSGSLRFSCMVDGALVRVTADGETWTTAFTHNNAWVGYDMLTRPVLDNDGDVVRYDGLEPPQVDLDKHIELAADCDALVPDGAGGTEALSEFDGIFDSASTLWDALLRVYQGGRAVPYYQGVMVTLAINKAQDVSDDVFVGMGNTVYDTFRQHWSGTAKRPGELVVEFLDRDADYARTPRIISHPTLRSTASALNLDMFGTTRASQIWRDAMLRLNSNNLLRNTVSVALPVEGIEAALGKVIRVSHDQPQWGFSGRLAADAAAGGTTVVIDREVTLEEGTNYGIRIWLPGDTSLHRAVTEADGRTLTVSPAFAAGSVPATYDNYAFGELNLETKPFRIISIQPDMDFRFRLGLIEYNATVWGSDTGDPVLPTPNYSALTTGLAPVENLALGEQLVKRDDGTIAQTLDVYFDRPADARWREAEIWVDTDDGGFVYTGRSAGGHYQVPCAPLTTYTVAVLSVNYPGERMPWGDAPTASLTTSDPLLDTPSPVTGVVVTDEGVDVGVGGAVTCSVRVSWTDSPADEHIVDYSVTYQET